MGFDIRNIEGKNHQVIEQNGIFAILEHVMDESVSPHEAIAEYYRSKMNIRKRQLIAQIDDEIGLKLQKGAMQWMAGDVSAVSGVKPTNFFGKLLKSAVTNESPIKPEYSGSGIIVTEPTYHHLLIESVDEWTGGLVLEDGMFLACESNIDLELQGRKTLSGAALGNEGLFNLKLTGNGFCVLESSVPRSELIEVILEDDVLKIDGSFAVCWSGSLTLSVEKSAKTLIGSALSGEGLVNVYRGSGRVFLAPLNSEQKPAASTAATAPLENDNKDSKNKEHS